MYMCALGIPKGNFLKQMKNKLSYRIIRIKLIFSGVYWCIMCTKSLTNFGLLFVCEWIGPGYTASHSQTYIFVCEWIGPDYTSINSGKNALNPIVIDWCLIICDLPYTKLVCILFIYILLLLWIMIEPRCLFKSYWISICYLDVNWLTPKISACRARIWSLVASERSERVTSFIFCRAGWYFSVSIIFTFRWHGYHP